MRRRVLESSAAENTPNFGEVKSNYPILNFSDFYWYFGDRLIIDSLWNDIRPTDISHYINFYTGGSYFSLYDSWNNFENHEFIHRTNIKGVIPDFPYIQGPILSVDMREAKNPWSYIMVLELYLYTRPIDLNEPNIIPIMFYRSLCTYFAEEDTYNNIGTYGYGSMSNWYISIGGSLFSLFYTTVYNNTIEDKDYIIHSFRSISYDSSTYDQWGVGIRFHLIS